jgi:hypothetical protein
MHTIALVCPFATKSCRLSRRCFATPLNISASLCYPLIVGDGVHVIILLPLRDRVVQYLMGHTQAVIAIVPMNVMQTLVDR